MKMYIAVLDSAPIGIAITAAAHASIACFRQYEDRAEMQEWINGTFYKVVVSVPAMTLAELKETPDHTVITESSLDGAEVAIAFCPREEWPKGFKFFSLYKG